MIKIRNARDLRSAYEIMILFEKCGRECSEDIKNIKKDIREYHKAQEEKIGCMQELIETGETTFIKGDYDPTYYEYHIIDDPLSKEELHEIWEENQVYSPYDCTGQKFIMWINQSHLKNGKYLVVIVWGLDI